MTSLGLLLGLVLGVGAAGGGAYFLTERDWILPDPLPQILPDPLDGSWDGTATLLTRNTDPARDRTNCVWAGVLDVRIRRAEQLELTLRKTVRPDLRSRCSSSTTTETYSAEVAHYGSGSPRSISFTDAAGNLWQLERTRETWLEGGITPAAGSLPGTLYADDIFISRHEGGADDPHVMPRMLLLVTLLAAGGAAGLGLGSALSATRRTGRPASP